MSFYIALSALYRLSCGALILAINWIVATNTFSYFAILVILTFFPALVVPFFWKENKTDEIKLSIFSLSACALLCLCLFFVYNQILILILNTLLWFFFFIMESSWEAWFVNLSQTYTAKKTQYFSSISMSINQVSLMIGALFASFAFTENPRMTLLFCAFIFFL